MGKTVVARLGIAIACCSLHLITPDLMAQAQEVVLSAQDSDPIKLGWMQGFPPPKYKVLSAVDGSFFQFPALRWSVVHMRELLPTVTVDRGSQAVQPLPYKLDAHIDSVRFTPWGQKDEMTWDASLWKNYTDGIIVLHKGSVVYERYFGALTEHHVHAVMSLTKSFTGTLASMLVAEGTLDEHQKVSAYVPELAQSAFGDASVREVMDMTTDCNTAKTTPIPKRKSGISRPPETRYHARVTPRRPLGITPIWKP